MVNHRTLFCEYDSYILCELDRNLEQIKDAGGIQALVNNVNDYDVQVTSQALIALSVMIRKGDNWQSNIVEIFEK
jgi:hypothetical protein